MVKLNIFKIKIFIFVTVLGFLFLNLRPKADQKVSPSVNRHLMTVYIHGTVLPHFSFRALRGAMKNKNKQSFYARYLNELRNRPVYKLQPIGKLGLEKIDLEKKSSEKSPNQLITKSQRKMCKAQKEPYTKYSFYTFGWDGRLSMRKRRQWARRLYSDLISEIKKQKYSNLEIQIMAHSHGGNVTLHLHEIERELKKNLFISKLILLGTPVQSETKDYVTSSMFGKIYNIYSRNDTIQVLDIISTKDFFSKRCFEPDSKKKFTLPDNLTQIEIEVGRLKPRHCEFWFFGCGKLPLPLYRRKFSIYPFPVATFVPVITSLADSIVKDDKNIKIRIERNKRKNIIQIAAIDTDKNVIKKSVLKLHRYGDARI